MLGTYDFCGHYDWTFEWLRQNGGEPLLRRYWEKAIGEDSQRHAAVLFARKGFAGMREYWAHALTEEAAGYVFSEKPGLARFDMHECPSKGFLLRNGLHACHDYCDHCIGWIGPSMRKAGFVVHHEHNHLGQCWWEFRRREDPSSGSAPGEVSGAADVRGRPGWMGPGAHLDRYRAATGPDDKAPTAAPPVSNGLTRRSNLPASAPTAEPLPQTRDLLDTPCLVLDLDRLDRNLREMQARVAARGKGLRPHAKSHKCSALVRRQLELGAVGVCVAKLAEAEALIAAGIRGTLVTGPVLVPTKEERLLACLRQDPGLLLTVDSADAARRLDALLRPHGLRADVLLDLDIGLGRTGIPCPAAPALAREIASLPGLRLRGIQAYAGHVQHLHRHAERRRASLESLGRAAEVFRHLRAEGLALEIFTGAGTGTHDIDLDVPELTDLQPGSYALMDAEYLAVESAGGTGRFEGFPPALTLLSTVVSAGQKGFVTVDAGLKALYRDGATPEVLRPSTGGYRYDWFGDEYGRILVPPGAPPLGVGDRVEMVVSHCDPTVNLFDRFILTRGERVEGTWPIDLRGCCR